MHGETIHNIFDAILCGYILYGAIHIFRNYLIWVEWFMPKNHFLLYSFGLNGSEIIWYDIIFKYKNIDSKPILKVLIISAEKYIQSSEYEFNKNNNTYHQCIIEITQKATQIRHNRAIDMCNIAFELDIRISY